MTEDNPIYRARVLSRNAQTRMKTYKLFADIVRQALEMKAFKIVIEVVDLEQEGRITELEREITRLKSGYDPHLLVNQLRAAEGAES